MIDLIKATPTELETVLKLEEACFEDNYTILQVAEDIINHLENLL